jgi:hypothetical protein
MPVPPIQFAVLLLVCCTCYAQPPREFSIDLWDWTAPCRDLPTFKRWAADMRSIGVTRVEISVPWNLLEAKKGEYDLSFIADRLAVAKSLGLSMRIRLNSYYAGATPPWYDGDFWCDINGKAPEGTPRPVSISDERFWKHFAPLCTKIAATFRGEDIYFSPFLGVHAEVKWSDWWSYDDSTLAKWRVAIKTKPTWLSDVAGDAALPDKPPIPPPTDGTPDNSPVSKAWIAFRELCWRESVARFVAALRAGDSAAKISVPLGESFRRESAAMSNLDYFGLSRGADQIVHSYDFFWHPKDDPWHAAAAVACFRGITGVQNIAFEFDGPALIQNLGYDLEKELEIADAVIAQGAGLKAANYSYSTTLPSSFPVLVAFGQKRSGGPGSDFGELSRAAGPGSPESTVLLFLSKWTNYCYREKTQWLNDAQLGAWRMLTSRGLNVRIICEDNLDEDLTAYQGLYVAFSPPELMPFSRSEQLAALLPRLPSVIELSEAPPARPTTAPARAAPVPDQWLTLNYPLAYHWTAGDPAECKDLLDLCVKLLSGSKP